MVLHPTMEDDAGDRIQPSHPLSTIQEPSWCLQSLEFHPRRARTCSTAHYKIPPTGLKQHDEGRAMILVASALVEPQHGPGCGKGKLSPLDLNHGPKLGKDGVRAQLKLCVPESSP